MKVLESWRDSLRLCKAESVKMFILLTLKSMYEVARSLCVVWFWLPAALVVSLATILGGMRGCIGTISFILSCLSFLFLIAARPSIGIKDFEYFRENVLRALWLMVLSFIALWWTIPLFRFLENWLGNQSSLAGWSEWLGLFVLFLFGIVLVLSPLIDLLFDFAILFYLDRKEGVFIAFKRAFRMVLYNIPLLVVYFGSMLVVCFVIEYVIMLLLPVNETMVLENTRDSLITRPVIIASLLSNVWRCICKLFMACLAVNVYIKRIHDQSQVYIPHESPAEK